MTADLYIVDTSKRDGLKQVNEVRSPKVTFLGAIVDFKITAW